MRYLKVLVLCWLVSVQAAWACEVCFGNPDDPQTKGMQGAILTMLFVTYFTIISMIAVFVILLRKHRRLAEQKRSLTC